MRYHKYKNRPGGYYRGRSRSGRFYTRQSGCLIPLMIATAVILLISLYLI